MEKIFFALISMGMFFSCNNKEDIDVSINQSQKNFTLERTIVDTKSDFSDDSEDNKIFYTLTTPDKVIENYELTPKQAEYINQNAVTFGTVERGEAYGVDEWYYNYNDTKNYKLSITGNSNHDINHGTGIFIARKIWVVKKIELPSALVVAKSDTHDWTHMGWHPNDETVCGATAAVDGFTLTMRSGCWYVISNMLGQTINKPYPKRFSNFKWKYIYQEW